MTIFANQAEAVAEARARFAASGPLAHLATMDAALLYAKLRAGEADVARRLRIFLEPTKVFADGSYTQAEIDALTAASKPYVVDPGYDYNPDFFRDNKWGYLIARRRPIISVEKWSFVYGQDGQQPVFDVPQNWLRIDRKYGHIQLVPVGSPVTLPLSQYMLSAYGGGRTIPHMVRLTYTAGLQNVKADYPDLYDFIFRNMALSALKDRFASGSSSISADGLSESESVDIKTYIDSNGGAIEGEFKSWSQFFNGPITVVV